MNDEITRESIVEFAEREGRKLSPEDVEGIYEISNTLYNIDKEFVEEVKRAQDNYIKKAQNLNLNPNVAIPNLADTMSRLSSLTTRSMMQTFLLSKTNKGENTCQN